MHENADLKIELKHSGCKYHNVALDTMLIFSFIEVKIRVSADLVS